MFGRVMEKGLVSRESEKTKDQGEVPGKIDDCLWEVSKVGTEAGGIVGMQEGAGEGSDGWVSGGCYWRYCGEGGRKCLACGGK